MNDELDLGAIEADRPSRPLLVVSTKIGPEYAALNLPPPVWCDEPFPRPNTAPIWHRWGAVPGGSTGVWGWDRWCRDAPSSYCAPRDAPAEPPAGARVCRRCRQPLPRWMERPLVGDVLFGGE